MIMIAKRAVVSTFVLVAAATAAGPATAATICVNPSGGGCETTVQAGIDAAVAGDTVRIEEGRYDENVTISLGLDGLLVEGVGGVIDADLPNTGVGITVLAPNVVLDGVIVHNGSSGGILLDTTATGGRIRNVSVRGSGTSCITVLADGVTIEDSILHGSGARAVVVVADDFVGRRNEVSYFDNGGFYVTGSNITIAENSFFQGDGDMVEIENGSGAVITGNSGSDTDDKMINFFNVDEFLISGNHVKESYEAITVACSNSVCSGEIRGNSASDITQDGAVELSYSNASGSVVTVESNTASRTKRGIFVSSDGSASIAVIGNRVIESFGGGNCVETGSSVAVSGNKLKGCAMHGIFIDGNESVVDRNKVSRTLGNGIAVAAGLSGNAVTNNVAKRTTGVGVTVQSGNTATVVQGNAAFKTREDFCDGGTGTIVSGNAFTTTFDPMGGDCPAGTF